MLDWTESFCNSSELSVPLCHEMSPEGKVLPRFYSSGKHNFNAQQT